MLMIENCFNKHFLKIHIHHLIKLDKVMNPNRIDLNRLQKDRFHQMSNIRIEFYHFLDYK